MESVLDIEKRFDILKLRKVSFTLRRDIFEKSFRRIAKTKGD